MENTEIMTRKEAKEKGLSRYFTGKPCTHGHISLRRVSDGHCIFCMKNKTEYKAEYYLKNKDKISEHRKEYAKDNFKKLSDAKKRYYYENKEELTRKQKEYYLSTRDLQLERRREYYEKNKENLLAKNKETSRHWRRNNKDKINAQTAWRRAAKLQRTPAWANRKEIDKFYKEAQRLTKEIGIQYHVDHIIPLQGETVSGFHIETNLRVIPAFDNMSKSNKLIEDLLC